MRLTLLFVALTACATAQPAKNAAPENTPKVNERLAKFLAGPRDSEGYLQGSAPNWEGKPTTIDPWTGHRSLIDCSDAETRTKYANECSQSSSAPAPTTASPEEPF